MWGQVGILSEANLLPTTLILHLGMQHQTGHQPQNHRRYRQGPTQ